MKTFEEHVNAQQGAATLWPGTVSMMQLFVQMVADYAGGRGGNLTPALLEASALSMVAQLEMDLAFHPETKQAVAAWDQRHASE